MDVNISVMDTNTNTTYITGDHGKVDVIALAKQMHWTSSAIFGTFFLVVGLLGNTCSLLVWSRKAMRSTTGYYLMAQAVADIAVLILFFITDSLIMIDSYIKTLYCYGVFFAYIGYPINYFAVIVSIWMTVGVTVDRYIMVCWFQHAKKFCSKKGAIFGISIITLLCFIINLPHFSTYYAVPDTDRRQDDPAFAKTEFGAGHGSEMYEFWVHCMFLILAPWVTIFTLNIRIVWEVVQSNRIMKAGKTDQANAMARKAENQLTLVLLTATFTFLALMLLQCVTQCYVMLQPKSANMRIVSEAFAVAKLGVVINSSINFFLYCLSGKRFRRELVRLFSITAPKYDTSFTMPLTDYSTA